MRTLEAPARRRKEIPVRIAHTGHMLPMVKDETRGRSIRNLIHYFQKVDIPPTVLILFHHVRRERGLRAGEDEVERGQMLYIMGLSY